MNPFASVDEISPESIKDVLSGSPLGRYSAFVYGLRTFSEGIALSECCREANIPFYMLNTSGLHGFFFIDIGRELTFLHHRKDTQTDESQTITSSRTLKDCLTDFLSKPLPWRRREIHKNDKYLLSAILSKYTQEESSQGNLQSLVTAFAESKGLPSSFSESAKKIVGEFDRAFNLDFNPTSSVIGAIVSQEIVKVITQRDFPSHGIAVYDSSTQRCQFE